jgi:hypothetical protein
MAQCAWCRRPDATHVSTAYFQENSTHGICPACAIERLIRRPRALYPFLMAHMEELIILPPPTGYVIIASRVYLLRSYPQLLCLLKQALY